MTGSKLLNFSSVDFSFDQNDVVKDFSLSLSEGSVCVLLGPSGCGKSTLLRLGAGLLRPKSGVIQLSTKNISFIFQSPNLLPWLNVYENVILPFKIKNQKFDTEKVLNLLNEVGLSSAKEKHPHELSGGMKMRVSLARALISDPELIFCDEPFSALDELTRMQMQDLLLKLKYERNLSVMFVTHSMSEAAYLADEVLLLDKVHCKIRDKKIIQHPSEIEKRRSENLFNTISSLTQKASEVWL